MSADPAEQWHYCRIDHGLEVINEESIEGGPQVTLGYCPVCEVTRVHTATGWRELKGRWRAWLTHSIFRDRPERKLNLIFNAVTLITLAFYLLAHFLDWAPSRFIVVAYAMTAGSLIFGQWYGSTTSHKYMREKLEELEWSIRDMVES